MRGVVCLLIGSFCVLGSHWALGQVAPAQATTGFRATLDATQFTGSDACAQINAAEAALPASGGVVDARGFGDVAEKISTTCTSSATPLGTQFVRILFNPATLWIPATASTVVLAVNPNSMIDGMHINAAGTLGYRADAVSFTQNYDADKQVTRLENFQIDLPAGASGNSIYASPSPSGNGMSGVSFENFRINGGNTAISLVAGANMSSQWINGNSFKGIWVKNAVTCINLNGAAQKLGPNTTAISGNHFTHIDCQYGPNTVSTLKLQNASQNFFVNVNQWDGGSASWDANSGFNYWEGIGAWQVGTFAGPGNNYFDAQGDSVSSSGLHSFRYGGGVNFIGRKVQLTDGKNTPQLQPASRGGRSAIQISSPGCCANTYLTGNSIDVPELDILGKPVIAQTVTGSHGSSGTKLQLSDGTGAPGNFEKFGPDGSSTDSSLAVTAVPQKISTCGTTTLCTNSAQASPRIVWGIVTLSSGSASVGSMTPWTSSSSYGCTCTDTSTTVAACNVQNTSTTSITVNGTGTDAITYVCVGN